jgi:hypothetical protein
MTFKSLLFILFLSKIHVYSLVIEDTFKLCPKSVCSVFKQIEIPEETDICTKDLFFTYNNNKNIGYLTSSGKLLEKSKRVRCENLKKNYTFTYGDKRFEIFQYNNTISIKYSRAGEEIISGITLNSNFHEFFDFLKNNLALCLVAFGFLALILGLYVIKCKFCKNRKDLSYISRIFRCKDLASTKSKVPVVRDSLDLVESQHVIEPVSSVPVSSVQVSSVQVSSVPVSRVPVSSVPVSSAPVSRVPVSSVPVSSAPVSSAPVSSVPVSRVPVSSAPVSSATVSSAPVSSAPVSSVPVRVFTQRENSPPSYSFYESDESRPFKVSSTPHFTAPVHSAPAFNPQIYLSSARTIAKSFSARKYTYKSKARTFETKKEGDIPCEVCGGFCSEGAGMSSHMRIHK